MFGAILKATNSDFQKGMTFYRSKYVKKFMKLLAFIFEQPSNIVTSLVIFIGVAPITQHTHVHTKNSNAQGSSPDVVKVISMP